MAMPKIWAEFWSALEVRQKMFQLLYFDNNKDVQWLKLWSLPSE